MVNPQNKSAEERQQILKILLIIIRLVRREKGRR